MSKGKDILACLVAFPVMTAIGAAFLHAAAEAWRGRGDYDRWVTSLGSGDFVAKFGFPVLGAAVLILASLMLGMGIAAFFEAFFWKVFRGSWDGVAHAIGFLIGGSYFLFWILVLDLVGLPGVSEWLLSQVLAPLER